MLIIFDFLNFKKLLFKKKPHFIENSFICILEKGISLATFSKWVHYNSNCDNVPVF